MKFIYFLGLLNIFLLTFIVADDENTASTNIVTMQTTESNTQSTTTNPIESEEKKIIPFTKMFTDLFHKAKSTARAWSDSSLSYFG